MPTLTPPVFPSPVSPCPTWRYPPQCARAMPTAMKMHNTNAHPQALGACRPDEPLTNVGAIHQWHAACEAPFRALPTLFLGGAGAAKPYITMAREQ